MRLYLAHPILVRKEVREAELKFEEKTGIELVNPFYDGKRYDFRDNNNGKLKEWDMGLDHESLIENDVKLILSTDGLVAVIPLEQTIGVICELMIAKQFNKKVYIVTSHKPWLNHPWLKYVSDVIVSNFEELTDILNRT